jgi:hypothetical protein
MICGQECGKMDKQEKDIVERLEEAKFSEDYPLMPSEYRDLCGQAADEIERLREENARMARDLALGQVVGGAANAPET